MSRTSCIRAVRRFAAFLRRSPDTATAEELRAFQLHMVDTGTAPPTDVIYNVQCKNSLVDLNRIETGGRRFVRYNRSLDRAYRKALDKERARDGLLLKALDLAKIKHFVVSRFPVATQNPHVLAFGEISRFRAMAVSTAP